MGRWNIYKKGFGVKLQNCNFPWSELNMSYDHQLRCCCYFKEVLRKWDYSKPLDFLSFWNGPEMQHVRSIVISGISAGSGCRECIYFKYHQTDVFATIPDDLNKIQKENWKKMLTNHNKTIIDNVPIRFYFNFGLKCNLNCIMCSQADIRKVDKNYLPGERIFELKEYLLPANEFVIIGGEPLIIPGAVNFIDSIIADRDFQDNRLTIFTNGYCLDKFIEKLKNIKRVSCAISIDSIKDTYEYIRRGSKWDVIERNIDMYREVMATTHPQWTLNIASLVMKSSLKRIDEMVEFCISKNIPVHLAAMQPMSFTNDEDVFNNKSLLLEVPDWEQRIDRAIDILTKKGWVSAAAYPLELFKKQLKG